jgi:hypothetical protein
VSADSNVKTLVPWKVGTPEAVLQQTQEVVRTMKGGGLKVGVITIVMTESQDHFRLYSNTWSEDMATEFLVYAAKMLEADAMEEAAEEDE